MLISKLPGAADRAAEQALMRERQEMRAWKRAINWALSQRSVTESPTMSASYPTAVDLLQAVDWAMEDLGETHPIVRARRDIVEYIRVHPDASAFRDFLGVDDNWIDHLFRDAISFENGE